MSDRDGGPAFPCEVQVPIDQEIVCLPGDIVKLQGMSLRDWFAGKALVGLLASPDNPISSTAMAQACYKLADAMLHERHLQR